MTQEANNVLNTEKVICLLFLYFLIKLPKARVPDNAKLSLSTLNFKNSLK